MQWSDFLSPTPLLGGLCLFLAAAVTIHAAHAGSLSRPCAIVWLTAFLGLTGLVVWNGGREGAERRQEEADRRQQEIDRARLEDERWGKLLGLTPTAPAPPPPRTEGTIRHTEISPEIRLLSRAEQRKLTVLLGGMAPYNAEVYHANNPTSAAVAKQFANMFRE